MVKKQVQVSWRYWKFIDQINSILQGLTFEIQHTYREGNAVADSLANTGVIDRESHSYDSPNNIPVVMRFLMQQDSRNIKSLRKRLRRQWDSSI